MSIRLNLREKDIQEESKKFKKHIALKELDLEGNLYVNVVILRMSRGNQEASKSYFYDCI